MEKEVDYFGFVLFLAIGLLFISIALFTAGLVIGGYVINGGFGKFGAGVFDGFMLTLGLWLIVAAANTIVRGKW